MSKSSCGIPHTCDRPGVSVWAPVTAETTPSFPLLGAGKLKEPSGKSLGKAKEPFPASNFSPPGSQGFWGGCLIYRAWLALSLSAGASLQTPREQPGGIPGYGPPALLPFIHRMQQCVSRDEAYARNRESLGDEVPLAAPTRAPGSCHAGRRRAQRAGPPQLQGPRCRELFISTNGPRSARHLP